MRLLPLRLLLALALAVGLGSCGDPDPEQAADDLASMKQAVNAELRDMAAAITGTGLAVERAQGRVESEGMSTYRAEDYKASAVVVGEGAEGGEPGGGAMHHGQRDRAAECDDGSGCDLGEDVVEGEDLQPVGVLGGAGFVVEGGDGGLDLILAHRSATEGAGE